MRGSGTLDRSASRTKSLHLRARDRRGCRQSAFRPDGSPAHVSLAGSGAGAGRVPLVPLAAKFRARHVRGRPVRDGHFRAGKSVSRLCANDRFVCAHGRFVGLDCQPVSYHDADGHAVFRLALLRPGGERRPLGPDAIGSVGGPRPGNKANCSRCSLDLPPSSTTMRMRSFWERCCGRSPTGSRSRGRNLPFSSTRRVLR